jgi:hypothetical protein
MSKEAKRKTITIEREYPELNYELMEGSLKNLQGQVLTVIEVIGGTMEETRAAKSLVRSFFNQKLTHLFDMYGHETDLETPNYSGPNDEVDGFQTLENQ